ncbi:MAG: chymotrypsin family serine protease [Planctomycetota bacterium]
MRNRWMALGIVLCLVGGIAVAGSGKKHQAELNRPIELGVSGGNAESAICFAGTLGCLVEEADGDLHILSNNHVFSRDVNDGLIGDRVTQPGKLDNGCVLDPQDVVANVSALKLIDWNGTNGFDAALAEVVSGTVDADGTILGIGSPDPEVAQASVGMSVMKAGRTTGKTQGTVQFVDVTVQVNYGGGRIGTFMDQIGCGGGGFSQPGDSGAVILATDLKPVALLFAGGSGLTFGSPIQAVLDEFGVTVVGTGTSSKGGKGGKGGGGGGGGKGKGPKPKASQVKAKHGKSLLAVQGVHGHGVGRSANRDVIVIFVEKDTTKLRARLPRSLDGIPVDLVVTGTITPY